MLLNTIRKEVLDVSNSGSLESPRRTRNMIVLYRNLEHHVMDIELYRYLAIIHYREDVDAYFEDLLVRIYKEIGSLQTLPFICTFSNSETYYWAEVGSGMIALPYGEEKNMLNLSDLYHEIGHFLYDQHKDDFTGKMPEFIDAYYKEKAKDYPQAMRALKRWESSWMEEFTCDLIATYLTGPAYAWTHLKISMESSVKNLYGDIEDVKLATEHPSNEARMRAVCEMLRLTGYTEELVEIGQEWSGFLRNVKSKQPDNYDHIHPQGFITVLAQSVLEGCRNMALCSYAEQLAKGTSPVAQALNEAWTILRSSPDQFKEWEINKVRELGFVA